MKGTQGNRKKKDESYLRQFALLSLYKHKKINKTKFINIIGAIALRINAFPA